MNNFKIIFLDAIKLVLKNFLFKKIFGAIVGGFKGIILTYVIDLLFSKIVKPGYLFIFRKIEILIEKIKVRKKIEDLKDAETEEEFNNAVDDLP